MVTTVSTTVSTTNVLDVVPAGPIWAAVALVFVLLVVVPAVWSKRADRAVTVLRLLADTVVAAITAWRAPPR